MLKKTIIDDLVLKELEDNSSREFAKKIRIELRGRKGVCIQDNECFNTVVLEGTEDSAILIYQFHKVTKQIDCLLLNREMLSYLNSI